MEPETQNQLKLLNNQFNPNEEFIFKERKDIQIQADQNDINNLLTLQDLEMKTAAILSRTNNSPGIERDFRRTCELFENQKSTSSSQLNEAYQKYVYAYYKITSLCIIVREVILLIYNTEKEVANNYSLDSAPGALTYETRMTLLPNGELFFYGEEVLPGITFIVNSHYEIRLLPKGAYCWRSSAIYFNRSVYCFGGAHYWGIQHLSRKYDLDSNRWIKLTEMPIADYWCSSVMFNRNILISGTQNRNLMLYSIDIDSFSIIPYDFAKYAKKLLINVERLYLLECKLNGFVYENEAGKLYEWKKIAKSIICMPYQASCVYNKGKIYIITENLIAEYYKFDLDKNEMSKV